MCIRDRFSGETLAGVVTEEDFDDPLSKRVEYFEFDSISVPPEATRIVEAHAEYLENNPNMALVLEGHADERGTREYNLALGERRANSVKDYLVAAGVNPERIKTISYGKERPVALGSNEDAWLQNRRGVTKVSGAGS